jgi:hypothetical protein
LDGCDGLEATTTTTTSSRHLSGRCCAGHTRYALGWTWAVCSSPRTDWPLCYHNLHQAP